MEVLMKLKRRSVLGLAAGAIVMPYVSRAHYTGFKHKHPNGPSTGSDFHVPAFSESSFDRGSLENYLRMPPCVFIVHHASFHAADEFDTLNLGWSQFPVWVREDAPIEDVSLSHLSRFLESGEPLFRTDSGPAYVLRHASRLNQEAFVELVGRLGVSRRRALSHRKPDGAEGKGQQQIYRAMREHCLGDPSAVMIGFRGENFQGLKSLTVDGRHPRLDWQDYPLTSETHIYIRRNSQLGELRARRFFEAANARRAADHEQWSALLGV
jgi:hypothetical protein